MELDGGTQTKERRIKSV